MCLGMCMCVCQKGSVSKWGFWHLPVAVEQQQLSPMAHLRDVSWVTVTSWSLESSPQSAGFALCSLHPAAPPASWRVFIEPNWFSVRMSYFNLSLLRQLTGKGGGCYWLGENSDTRTTAVTVTLLLLNRQSLVILNITPQNKVLWVYSSQWLQVLAKRTYHKGAAHSTEDRLKTDGFMPHTACPFNYQLLWSDHVVQLQRKQGIMSISFCCTYRHSHAAASSLSPERELISPHWAWCGPAVCHLHCNCDRYLLNKSVYLTHEKR